MGEWVLEFGSAALGEQERMSRFHIAHFNMMAAKPTVLLCWNIRYEAPGSSQPAFSEINRPYVNTLPPEHVRRAPYQSSDPAFRSLDVKRTKSIPNKSD
jgi:hypothetical protein